MAILQRAGVKVRALSVKADFMRTKKSYIIYLDWILNKVAPMLNR
jgi:hypothetical protein